MAQTELAKLLQDLPPGVLCTSDGKGDVDAAVFGSAQLQADGRFVVALGDNRTLRNLQQNPKAAYIAYRAGKTLLDSKGVRLHLELEKCAAEGPLFDEALAQVELNAGKYAARLIKTVAIFRIDAVRPLIEFPAAQ